MHEYRPNTKSSTVKSGHVCYINAFKDTDITAFLRGALRHILKSDNVNFHNLYVGMVLRYGVLCAIFYGAFWLTVFIKATIIWMQFREIKARHLKAGNYNSFFCIRFGFLLCSLSRSCNSRLSNRPGFNFIFQKL